MTRLEEHYNNIVRHDLLMKFNLQRTYSHSNNTVKGLLYLPKKSIGGEHLPKLKHLIISLSFSDVIKSTENIYKYIVLIQLISNHKAYITNSKKSIASFQLRDGMPIGCKVTLRKDDMYFFLDKLITQVMPKMKEQLSGTTNFTTKTIKNKYKGKFISLNLGTISPNGYSFGISDLNLFNDIEESGQFPRSTLIGCNILIATSTPNAQLTSFILQSLQIPIIT
jgi:ribosomal protein L5